MPRAIPAKQMSLSLPLTPESPNDPKGSPFENKTIEQTLSVELSGTAAHTCVVVTQWVKILGDDVHVLTGHSKHQR
ncbi:UNVERIFIED_CONTAM: Peroxisome proliferator-activated receptor gamma coactivator 1-alpha [Gekko kuhli]